MKENSQYWQERAILNQFGWDGHALKIGNIPRLVSTLLNKPQENLAGIPPIDLLASTLFQELPAEEYSTFAHSIRHFKLTPTEVPITILLSRGNSSRQIAEALQLTDRTIRNHLGPIARKMWSKGMLKTAKQAFKYGIYPHSLISETPELTQPNWNSIKEIEYAILWEVMVGKTYTQIAEEYNYEERTIRNTVSNCSKTLNVNNARHAAILLYLEVHKMH